MAYKISSGISEEELAAWLENAAKKFGTFDDGRVDYTNADVAPIVMCTLVSGGKILLARRGYGLADAEGYWSTINGFIDEKKPVKSQVKQEIREELNLKVEDAEIKVGKSYTLDNPREKRRYIVFPCRVTLPSKPEIRLNEEHTDYAWINREDLGSYRTLDDLKYAIDAALKA